MREIDYTRKPSIVTIKAAIKKANADGVTFLSLQWGENRILIEKTQWGWIGTGWIGKHGGQDLANLLQRGAL
jgi:hypothetical protein